jgi:hypothetical protein
MVRRSTFIVIAVFVILLGILLYLQNRPAEELDISTPTPTPEAVIDLAITDVTGLRIVNAEGSIFYATRDVAGTWTLVQPSLQGVLESGTIDAKLQGIIYLQPLTSMDASIGLEVLGLVDPRYVVRLSLVDGREILYEIGEETPTQSGYYVQLNNTDVFVAQKFSMDSVLGMLETIPLQPTQTPAVTETPADAGIESPTLTPTP